MDHCKRVERVKVVSSTIGLFGGIVVGAWTPHLLFESSRHEWYMYEGDLIFLSVFYGFIGAFLGLIIGAQIGAERASKICRDAGVANYD